VSNSPWVHPEIRADREKGVHSLPRFGLSRLKVLRSLEVEGWATDFIPAHNTMVMKIFSTITSPVFSELVILVEDYTEDLPSNVTLFDTLRAMNGVKPFKLVFLLDPHDLEEQWKLMGALDLVAARGLLNFLESPPTIRSA
jgi:hypothetical protein